MFVDNVYISLKIGDEDILDKNEDDYQNLLLLRIVFTAGAVLPQITCIFRTLNKKVSDYVVGNNAVSIQVGNSSTDCDNYIMEIIEKDVTCDDATGLATVSIAGVAMPLSGYSGVQFIRQNKGEALTGNSLQVVSQIAKNYLGFGLVTDIDDSDIDEPKTSVWRRASTETPASFIMNTVLHMNLKDSFPILYIDKIGIPHVSSFKNIKRRTTVDWYLYDTPKTNFYSDVYSRNGKRLQFNKFCVTSYKELNDAFGGYGLAYTARDSKTGDIKTTYYESEVLLANTSQAEKTLTASVPKIVEGSYTSNANVYPEYNSAYINNTQRNVQLSTFQGKAEFSGVYHRNVNVMDLVYVDGDDPKTNGKYVVDTIEICASYNAPFTENIYITRDNNNNIENIIAKASPTNVKNSIQISNTQKANIIQGCKRIRIATALAKEIIDGSIKTRLQNLARDLKYSVLGNFSIGGVVVADLVDRYNSLYSFREKINAISNYILARYLPPSVAALFKDFLIGFNKDMLLNRLLGVLEDYLPADLADILETIYDTIKEIFDVIDLLVQENKEKMQLESNSYNYGEDMSNSDIDTRIDNTIDTFKENTEGVDLPFPIVELTDSEKLLNDKKLEDLIADKTIEELENKDYLKDINKEEFKEVLLGTRDLDYIMINQINANAGINMYSRFWGTFNPDSIIEVTQFTVVKGFKDRYRTVNTTKLINARGGKCVYICLPKLEDGLKFYVNSVKVTMEAFDISLNIFDVSGNPIIYTVYYYEEVFNSNSVMLEVRKD